MTDILHLVGDHAMFGPTSCVAWGVEFVLKYHGRLVVNSQRFQQAHPNGLGFDQRAFEILKKERIEAWDEHHTLEEFLRLCRDDAKKNLPVVFVFPSGTAFRFDSDVVGLDWNFHCFCAAEINEQIVFLTRIFEKPEPIGLSVGELKAYRRLTNGIAALLTDGKQDREIHCLRHKLIE